MNQRRLTVLENKAAAAGIPRSGAELLRARKGLDNEACDQWLATLSDAELDNYDNALSAEMKAQGHPDIDWSIFTDEELNLISQGDSTPLLERGIAL